MIIWDTARNLQLEDGKGTISDVIEYVYLGVRIIKMEITNQNLMMELIEDEQLYKS